MSKTLVAYFSATGTTKKVAEMMAKRYEADLFEIVPKDLYTSEDLNWNNPDSRSTVEMDDPDSRPEISSKVSNMEEYDLIYLGFPIWWYRAPTIINTFLEMYNFEGKTIIPFATSGSSDMGKTMKFLLPSCKGATLCAGKRMPSNPTEADLVF